MFTKRHVEFWESIPKIHHGIICRMVIEKISSSHLDKFEISKIETLEDGPPEVGLLSVERGTKEVCSL